MTSIKIIGEKCVGCQQCLGQCPYGAIEMRGQKAFINEKCVYCGACLEACKFEAIDLRITQREQTGQKEGSGIWVYAEQQQGRLKTVVPELLGEACRLAAVLECKVSAVLLGSGMEDQSGLLFEYGADEVYLVDHPDLALVNEQLYPDLIVQLVRRYHPAIFLLGATSVGRSLAPRISACLETGLTADCTGLAIDGETGLLMQTRPAFGGNLMATIICPQRRPQMATVRPKVMQALEPQPGRAGRIIRPELKFPRELHTQVLEVLSLHIGEASLSEADIIISAGRGMGGPDHIVWLEKLAGMLGAGIGASRAVVDLNWMEYSQQVGQTGKTVAPRIYIACGISGAVQHLVGISALSYVIAINKDAEAPIFERANLGIVGDCLEVLPLLIEELKGRFEKRGPAAYR